MAQNLLSDNQADVETDTTGFAVVTSVISRDVIESAHGIASLKTITNGGSAEMGMQCNSVPAIPGQTYTASIFIRDSGTVQLALNEHNAGDAFIAGTKSAVITLTSTWTRYSVTRTFGAGVKAKLLVRTDVDQVITFYVDKLQIEQSSVATPWRLPSRWNARNVGRDLVVL